MFLGFLFTSIPAYALDYKDHIKFSKMNPTIENGVEICIEYSNRLGNTCNNIKSFKEGVCLTGPRNVLDCNLAKTLKQGKCMLTPKSVIDSTSD